MLKNHLAFLKRGKSPCLLLIFLLLSIISFGQQKTLISGAVTSETGSPLQGVSVLVRGSEKGTITDDKGQFSLDVPQSGTVVFSIIGYEPKQVTIGKSRIMNVTLTSRTSTLGDVVVIGYGTQKRKDLSGAVTSVNLSKTGELPIVSVDQMLI